MSASTSFPLHVDWRVTALTNSGSADVPGLAFERSGSFRLGLLEPEPPWRSLTILKPLDLRRHGQTLW